MTILMAVRRRVRSGTDAERGSTLVAAVAIGFICMALGSIVIASAIGAGRDSGRDRQRTGQVHAAEAGVDRAYYTLQTGATPCAVAPTSVGNSPDTTTVTTAIVYYNVAGTPLTCSGSGLSGVPVKALIKTASTSSNSVGPGPASSRNMESEVLLSPTGAGTGYAIFSDSALTVPNGFNLTGDGASSPDVYARGGFNCENSATLQGSVFAAQGGAQVSNACTVVGDLFVRDSVNQSGNSSLGSVRSSRGGLQIASNSTVVRDATVRTTVSGTRSSVKGTIRENQTMADPTDQRLPYIGYEPTKWQASGFTINNRGTDCGSIKTLMFEATTPTVFYGDCAINWSGNNKDLKLKTDVALFLTGGLTIENNFGMASNNTAQSRKLWLISPAGNGPAPAGWSPASTCPGGDITLGNQTDIDRSVNVFMYTCRSIDAANNSQFYGQLYGKQVTVSNAYNMTFVGLPPVGVDLGGAPAVPGFKVEVVYKRETR